MTQVSLLVKILGILLDTRDVAIGGGGGGGGGGVTPNGQTLVKVGQNGSDICPKLVKMELIFA